MPAVIEEYEYKTSSRCLIVMHIETNVAVMKYLGAKSFKDMCLTLVRAMIDNHVNRNDTYVARYLLNLSLIIVITIKAS